MKKKLLCFMDAKKKLSYPYVSVCPVFGYANPYAYYIRN
jgi:hypothetical protein